MGLFDYKPTGAIPVSELRDSKFTYATPKNLVTPLPTTPMPRLADLFKDLYPKKGKQETMDPAQSAFNEQAKAFAQPSQEFQQQIKGREVALRRSAGDLLGAQKAMQDPNYVLGSGSSLRKKPEPLAPEWTKLSRSARRLKRQGYMGAAQQMAAAAELERIGSPNIATQDQRSRLMFQDLERDVKTEEKNRQGDLYDLYLRKRNQQEMGSTV